MFKGSKNTPEKGFIAYSKNPDIPADARLAAPRIDDGGAACFRTPLLGGTEDKNLGRWYEARKNSLTGAWLVIRNQEINGEDDTGFCPQEVVLRDLCFFDALHFCGRAVAGANGDVLETNDSDVPLYNAVAETALVPLDLDGVPHPAMDGFILTTGDFSSAAKKLAQKTGPLPEPQKTAKTAEEKETSTMLPALFQKESAPVATEKTQATTIEDAIKKEQALRCAHEAAGVLAKNAPELLKNAEALKNAVHEIVQKDFHIFSSEEKKRLLYPKILTQIGGAGALAYGAAAGGFVATTFTFPFLAGAAGIAGIFIPILSFIDRVNERRPGSMLVSKKSDLLNNMEDWNYLSSEPEEKRLFLDFIRAAELVYGLEHVASLNERAASQKGGRREVTVSKAQEILNKTLSDTQVDKENSKKLRDQFNAGAFPARRSFLPWLDKAYEQLELEVNQRVLATLQKENANILPLPKKKEDAPAETAVSETSEIPPPPPVSPLEVLGSKEKYTPPKRPALEKAHP